MRAQEPIRDWQQGELLKEQGMARANANELEEWKKRANDAIEWLAQSGREFTAEDVRKRAGDPSNPNAFGPRLNYAARRGIITMVGYRKSERPSMHRRPVAVWKGANQ